MVDVQTTGAARRLSVKACTAIDWAGGAVTHPAEVAFEVGTELQLRVGAHYFGDTAPAQRAGGLDHLWDYEVVELFLAYRDRADGLRYLEIELGPHGHWLCLAFAEVRNARCCPVPVRVHAAIEDDRWSAEMTLPGHWAQGACAYNVCAIHGEGDARRYESAVRLPGQVPDFHQPQHFRPIG